MKITKYLHSCLLVEDQENTVLIDPGNYTYEDHALDINKLKQLDYILITHSHPDHCHLPFIKELVAKFPDVQIMSNPTVAWLLSPEGITVRTEATDSIGMETVPHEKLWDKEAPENTIFTVFNKLTHPGDTFQVSHTTDVLALPLQSPWGSTAAAVSLAVKLKPKVIIPIHDWHWKDDVRTAMYHRLTEFFAQIGMQFKGLETGKSVEV